jgi:predicted oxidoreductase
MSNTLDRVKFEKLTEKGKAVRAEYLRRYGASGLAVVGSMLRAHRVSAVVAAVLTSFGPKMFFHSHPTAEANNRAVPNASWPLP